MHPELKAALPAMRILMVRAQVTVEPASLELQRATEQLIDEISKRLTSDQISQLTPIKKGREAYRTLGKDPTRYRLSAEKLLRRMTKGEGLESINNLVDLSNYLSAQLIAPIGTFDFNKIFGTPILDFGREGEAYPCLANYDLSLKGLPIVRDDLGPFGSTTSDSHRTSVTNATKEMLMAVYLFDSLTPIDSTIHLVTEMLNSHANARGLVFEVL